MALGAATFSDIGGGISDLFAAGGDKLKAQALELKAQGDILEGQNYGLAATYAQQNAQYTATSTAIQQFQKQRQITQAQGAAAAGTAGAGLAASGSSLDVLAAGASQGALAKAVLGEQGLITEAGYQEQATSYQNMQKAAGLASQEDLLSAQAANEAATGAEITGGLKLLAGAATLI